MKIYAEIGEKMTRYGARLILERGEVSLHEGLQCLSAAVRVVPPQHKLRVFSHSGTSVAPAGDNSPGFSCDGEQCLS